MNQITQKSVPPDVNGEPPKNWDDQLYLDRYKDVADAVMTGKVANGYSHFIMRGLWEGREPAFKSRAVSSSLWPWSDALYLENNPGLKSALALHGVKPSQHYRDSGKKESRPTGIESRKQDFISRTGMSDWVFNEMGEQSHFEPGLDFLAYPTPLHYNPLSKSEWASGILKIKAHLRHDSYDFLFYLPWLKKGGADLASLYHINAVSRRGLKVAVVLTENTDSEWLTRLPRSVDVIPFGEIFGTIDIHCQAQIIYHLTSALAASKIHIINSNAAWEALKRFTLPLKAVTDIYVSLYCYDYTELDEPVGYARHIRKCIDGVTGIYTDNTTFKDHLVNEIGLNDEIIHVLPHPVLSQPTAQSYPYLSRKVLWASRLDRQKQPEILVEIAQRLPFITFDVYGSAVVGADTQILQKLQAVPNIIYKGPFSSPSDLTREQYRCFLYTSLWDGLPNIILEMLWSGMLVVAPDIGGIRADVGPENCIIVNDATSPEAYVNALKWLIQNPNDAEQLRTRGQSYVRTRHTSENFESILSSSNYFPPPV